MATTGASPSSIARLPSYRSTHHRFHPYPMVSRGRGEDYLMATIDRRSALGELDPIIEEPEAVTLARPLVPFGELPDRDFSPCDADHPALDDDLACHSEHAHDEPTQATIGHWKLAAAFVNMMFALRRKYLELLAGADLLKDEEEETK
ncbi:hypothetical protein C8T65DRAFT_629816 [Cerioporus squamosus]|nr:hypothetical protein C8T65DRAFT_629816 [Cerioporus squamosus]